MALLPLYRLEIFLQYTFYTKYQIYSYQDICRFYLLSCIMDMYTQIFLIMLIDFTEAELETIAAAMDDYMCYADDEFASAEDLIGGIPVAERVDSIIEKITNVICQ